MEEELSDTSPIAFECPSCGRPVELAVAPHAQIIKCCHCGGEFVVAGLDGSTDLASAENFPPEEPNPDDLDGLRVRSVATEKRAMIRHESYCVIGAAGSLVGAIQLIINAVSRIVRHDGPIRAAAYLFFALSLLILTWHLGRLAIHYHRQARRKILEDPKTPPDLSKLSDGSQLWKNLNKIE